MKKMISQALILSVFFLLLTGCGGDGNGRADVSKQHETGKTASADEWYELDADSGVLTIRLPDEKQGFSWAFAIADESILELLTQEAAEKQYVASFRALDDGETQITFSYSKADELCEVRVIEVRCAGDRVETVTADAAMDMSGTANDDGSEAVK